MRSLTIEQIIILLVLLGVPLLQAVGRWIKSLGKSIHRAPASVAPSPDIRPPILSSKSSSRLRVPRLRKGREALVGPDMVETAPAPPAVPVRHGWQRGESLPLRQAWILKTILDPPGGRELSWRE